MKSRTCFELMREREPLRIMLTRELPTPRETSIIHVPVVSRRKTWNGMIWQFVCFALVGCLNTAIDLLVLNGLLLVWPTQNIAKLLLFNTIAYTFGALDSFALNKYWTFRRSGRPEAREVVRFLMVTLVAIVWNNFLLWFMGNILHPAHLNVTLWANGSKVIAIGGTILISYLGMRVWVFVRSSHEARERFVHPG